VLPSTPATAVQLCYYLRVLFRLLFRLILPAILGATMGFLALAFAIENEPIDTATSLAIVSPGLQAAELIAPAKHQSMASTFGNFLRIALGVNAAYYFAILAGFAWLAERLFWRRSRSYKTEQN
jgi:hypothetical protein